MGVYSRTQCVAIQPIPIFAEAAGAVVFGRRTYYMHLFPTLTPHAPLGLRLIPTAVLYTFRSVGRATNYSTYSLTGRGCLHAVTRSGNLRAQLGLQQHENTRYLARAQTRRGYPRRRYDCFLTA